VNRLKRAYDPKLLKPKPQQKRAKRAHKTKTKSAENEEAEFRNESFPMKPQTFLTPLNPS